MHSIRIATLKLKQCYYRNQVDQFYSRSMSFGITLLFMFAVTPLIVDGQQQRFTAQPRDTYALIGASATLYGSVAHKTGAVFWEKDGLPFAHETTKQSGFSGNTSWAIFGNTSRGEFNLQLIRLGKADSGSYTCVVTSPQGDTNAHRTSSPGRLIVLDLPAASDFPVCVLSIRDDLTADDVVELTCAYRINSTREVSLKLQRLGQSVELSNTQQVSRNGYYVKRHTVTLGVLDDGATYQCIATKSGRPSVSCTTEVLDVRHRPVVAVAPTYLLAKTGESAHFTCRVTSANPPSVTYQWYYRGVAVTRSFSGVDLISTSEGDDQIIIGNLGDPTGDLSVVCAATNAVGSTRVEALVFLEEPITVGLTRDELTLWLISGSLGVAAVVLLLLLAIWILDCFPCCRTLCNKKKNRHSNLSVINSSWSAADNFGLSPSPPARRLSDPCSTDFYLTRAIGATPPPPPTGYKARETRTRPRNTSPSSNDRNHSSTPQRNSRSLNHSTPGHQNATGHRYLPRRTQNERNGDPYRHGGNSTPGRSGRSEARTRGSGRNSGLSDSGLDIGVSSLDDSRTSTTPRETPMYAQIRRNGASSANHSSDTRDNNARAVQLVDGDRLPTSSTSPVTLRPAALQVPVNDERSHRMIPIS